MNDKAIIDSVKSGQNFGYMDKLKSVSDLPAKEVLFSLIKEAMLLNEQGIKKEKPKSDKPKVFEVPDYFEKLLSENTKAKEVFYSKSDSFRKEYIIWISDAKTDETQQKRMDEALEWIRDGKSRFWKFKK